MKYNGFTIEWDDEKEKFISVIDKIDIERTNLREIKRIIDDKDNLDNVGLKIDRWFRTNSIVEVDILRKKGTSHVVRAKRHSGRGSTEYFILKNNEPNKKLKTEIETLIKKQKELQKIIESKFDEMEQLK